MALTLLSLKDRSFTFFNFLRGISHPNSGAFQKFIKKYVRHESLPYISETA
jgi:hypothetical protein